MSSTEVSIDMIAEHIKHTLSRLEKIFQGQLWLIGHIVMTTSSGSVYAVRFKSGMDETEEFLHESPRLSGTYLIRPGEFTPYDSYNYKGTTTSGYVGFCPISKTVIVLDENRQVVARTSPVVAFKEGD